MKSKIEHEDFNVECALCDSYSCNCDGEEPRVDEDDWDLGPACGLDPEVCESCQ